MKTRQKKHTMKKNRIEGKKKRNKIRNGRRKNMFGLRRKDFGSN